MRLSEIITLVPSAAYTASFDTKSAPYHVSGFAEADFYLDVTAKSGTTPTLDVSIIKRNTIDGKWYPLSVFAQQNTTASIEQDCPSNIGWDIAVDVVITGNTPSFTFSLVAVLKD